LKRLPILQDISRRDRRIVWEQYERRGLGGAPRRTLSSRRLWQCPLQLGAEEARLEKKVEKLVENLKKK